MYISTIYYAILNNDEFYLLVYNAVHFAEKQLAEISDYIGNRREMDDSKPVPIGSPVGQNEPPVPISSHTQPSEPIGDKNRITSMALKRAGCAS
jgi:hypothetical protein